MSGALNSVFGGGGLGGIVGDIAGALFPPLGIATSLANMVTQGIGSAVGSALQTLTQVGGMPKFIAQEIGQIVNGVVGQLTQQSDCDCDAHVQQQCGKQVSDFADLFSGGLVKNAIDSMSGKSTKGGGSWFEALAEALGKTLDDQANTIKTDSEAVTGQSAKDNPSGFTKLESDSQRMTFMMNAADQVIKTLGEALATSARKQ